MRTGHGYTRYGSKRRHETDVSRRRFRPVLEMLEDRTLLSSQIIDADLSAIPLCTSSTAPQITAALVATPAPWAILSHGSIHYVTGTAVDVALTMPNCIAVTDILAGDFSLVEAERNSDGIDNTSNFYDLLSDEAVAAGQHRVTYRVYFSNHGDGSSGEYRFQVQNAQRRLAEIDSGTDTRDVLVPTAEYQFTLTEVKEIGSSPVISISEAELRNTVILSLYNAFEVGAAPDRLYDPSYDIDFQVGRKVVSIPGLDVGSGLEVETDTIHFGFDVKYDLPDGDIFDPCNPTVHVEGDFTLAVSADGDLVIAWTNGPHVDPDFPFLCEAVAEHVIGPEVSLLVDLFLDDVVTFLIQDKIKDQIQEQLAAFVEDFACGTAGFEFECTAFIAEGPFDIRPYEVRVPLDLSWPSVAIDVPYNINRLERLPMAGLALNAGETVLVTASGLVDACRENNALAGECETVSLGPAGLLNVETIPEPLSPLSITTGDGVVVQFNERIAANRELTKLRREYPCRSIVLPATLPLPSANVAALMRRLAYSPSDLRARRAVGLADVVDVDDALPGRLSFGNNDIGKNNPDISGCTDAYRGDDTYGSGVSHITISWIIASTANTTFNAITGQLTILGGDMDDEIGIAGTDNGVNINVNGVDQFYPSLPVRSVTVLSGAGNDVISIDGVSATLPVRLDAGDGTDTVIRDVSRRSWFVARGLEIGCAASVFTVTTTADGEPGSLRQAILDANTNCGVDTIAFDIAGPGVQSIRPLSALPTITDPVIIDGYSQPGSTPNTLADGNNAVLRIELDGSLAGSADGLYITAGGSTVRGLNINRFGGSGIHLQTGGGNVIVGSFIGTDVAGSIDLGNTLAGILIEGAADGNNTIGGTMPAARNLVSGNDLGGVLLISSGANKLQGNYVGTDASGTAALGNGAYGGILISSAPNNTVGGSAPGAGNLISSNVYGMIVQHPGASGNVIQGNRVGTDVTGTVGLGNIGLGILLERGASGNTIGGTTVGAGNLMSANHAGIFLSSTSGNRVQGNLIGTDITGMAALGNVDDGILMLDTLGELIGGTDPAARNVIAGNTRGGINMTHDHGSLIGHNYIGTDRTGQFALGNAADGVVVQGSSIGSIFRDNVISANGLDGMIIAGPSTAIAVRGNIIGLNAAGDAPLGNAGYGITIAGTNGLIGGPSAAERNVISANGGGIRLLGQNHQVVGNFVGTDRTGAVGLGNSGVGIIVDGSSHHTIGGAIAGAGNVISDNGYEGLRLQGSGATGNIVLGNRLGTNAAGTAALGNAGAGLWIRDGAADNVIGSLSDSKARNLISGNLGSGVAITDAATTRNLLLGNYVGINAAGTAALPNHGDGILIDNAHDNTVLGSTAVRSVISGNRGDGVEIRGAGAVGNRVSGVVVGLNPTLSEPIPNFGNGVFINGAPGNRIGGVTEGGSSFVNAISANHGHGILIRGPSAFLNTLALNGVGTAAFGNLGHGVLIDDAPDNLVRDNIIRNNGLGTSTPKTGLEIRGLGAHGNWVTENQIVLEHFGIRLVGATGNLIGGTSSSQGNRIAATTIAAVSLDAASTGNSVQANDIGANDGDGIVVHGADNLIGGLTPGMANYLVGNRVGVLISGAAATGNRVQGNGIGLGRLSGSGNRSHGVVISNGASNNQIGGATGAAGNTITLNAGDGVRVFSGTGNAILSNRIYDNGELGIDVGHSGQDGVTPNDTGGDPDTGANNLQNFPVITLAARSDEPTITVRGHLHSLPRRTFTIQVFGLVGCDASGHGEGRYLLSTFTRTTNNGGNTGTFEVPVSGPASDYLTATATLMLDLDGDGIAETPRDTSEFSACRRIIGKRPHVPVGDPPAPDGPGVGPGGPEGGVAATTSDNLNAAVRSVVVLTPWANRPESTVGRDEFFSRLGSEEEVLELSTTAWTAEWPNALEGILFAPEGRF